MGKNGGKKKGKKKGNFGLQKKQDKKKSQIAKKCKENLVKKHSSGSAAAAAVSQSAIDQLVLRVRTTSISDDASDRSGSTSRGTSRSHGDVKIPIPESMVMGLSMPKNDQFKPQTETHLPTEMPKIDQSEPQTETNLIPNLHMRESRKRTSKSQDPIKPSISGAVKRHRSGPLIRAPTLFSHPHSAWEIEKLPTPPKRERLDETLEIEKEIPEQPEESESSQPPAVVKFKSSQPAPVTPVKEEIKSTQSLTAKKTTVCQSLRKYPRNILKGDESDTIESIQTTTVAPQPGPTTTTSLLEGGRSDISVSSSAVKDSEAKLMGRKRTATTTLGSILRDTAQTMLKETQVINYGASTSRGEHGETQQDHGPRIRPDLIRSDSSSSSD